MFERITFELENFDLEKDEEDVVGDYFLVSLTEDFFKESDLLL